MRLPDELVRPIFDNSLVRGALVRIEDYPVEPGRNRTKYCIVLNLDCSASEILLALATSKVGKFLGAWRHDSVRIAAGLIGDLPRETVVDCRVLRRIRRTEIFDAFRNLRATIHAPVPPAVLTEIEAVVRRSRLLSPAEKRIVLGG